LITKRLGNSLLVCDFDGEVLVLDTESDRIHHLNVSSIVMSRMFAGSADVAEIAKVLAIDFNFYNCQSG
jgi:hypothetical protein